MLWQVHIPTPKEVRISHYEVTNSNQISLIWFMCFIIFLKVNIQVHMSEVTCVLETIYKKGGVFKYLNVFQCDNEAECDRVAWKTQCWHLTKNNIILSH